jgi:hypothetical protein
MDVRFSACSTQDPNDLALKWWTPLKVIIDEFPGVHQYEARSLSRVI